eukprot:388660_1
MISIPIHSMMKTIRRQRMKYVFCEYTNKKNLYDVCRDVANYRDVLFNKYNYKLMSSVDMKGNRGYTMSKQDVEDFINNECLRWIIGCIQWSWHSRFYCLFGR